MHLIGGNAVIDAAILINSIFAALVLIYGFFSRNLGTAIVAGLFVGLIHGGLNI